MRSKIRRLVTEVTDEPEGSAQLTPPLTPPDGEKYRKSRRNSERYNTTTHSYIGAGNKLLWFCEDMFICRANSNGTYGVENIYEIFSNKSTICSRRIRSKN